MGSPNRTEEANPAALFPDLKGLRVVVCEDEGVTLMQLRRMLSHEGLQVVDVAANGEAAIECVLRVRPDIVLMDIRMPKMDGLVAAERILQEYPVCIVMLTAFSDASYQRRAEEIGTCGYVVKPITKDILLPQIVAALEQFRER